MRFAYSTKPGKSLTKVVRRSVLGAPSYLQPSRPLFNIIDPFATTYSKFHSWHPSESVTEGSPEYYTQQDYTNGAKCWNGPHRSMHLHLKCGTENALLTIAELEKCEYLFEATTPALCLPLEDDGKKKDEL